MKYRNLILAITPVSSVAMAQISAANAGGWLADTFVKPLAPIGL